jgi:polar amino acid transport system substrate-binding protein
MSAAPSSIDSAVLRDLAPKGVLRAAINFGNSVLAQRDGAVARGVSVDLARELSRRLGVGIELVSFDAAGKVVEALKDDAWDVAFLAIDPKRAVEILFTPPYVQIEGAYLVRDDSPLVHPDEVDAPGIRVATGKGAAYELFLSRTLKHANVERLSTGRDAFNRLRDGEVEAAAGVRQIVEGYAREHGGMRVLTPSFMVIEQAMGTPSGREIGQQFLHAFIEEQKASGFVADALRRSGQGDALVAPAYPHSAANARVANSKK